MVEGGYDVHIPAGGSHGGRMAEGCRQTLIEAMGLNRARSPKDVRSLFSNADRGKHLPFPGMLRAIWG